MAGHPLKNAALLADRALGQGLERQVVAHHGRRLHDLGWDRALSPGPGLWVEGDPPPRPGNSLDLLIDGETALPRIAEALQSARTGVSIAGWAITPDLALTRTGPRVVLRDVLAELAVAACSSAMHPLNRGISGGRAARPPTPTPPGSAWLAPGARERDAAIAELHGLRLKAARFTLAEARDGGA